MWTHTCTLTHTNAHTLKHARTHTHTHTHTQSQAAVVKQLLDWGATIDAQSINGGTPLMRAIETSQRDIVKLLLERG